MCWLLIRAFSDDKATAWKIGDIVEVRPDDFTGWGTLEVPPRFYRVQIQGVDAGKVKLALEDRDETVIDMGADRPPMRILNRVRKFKIVTASIPQAIKNQLQSTGVVSVTKSQIRNFIQNNKGETEPIDGLDSVAVKNG